MVKCPPGHYAAMVIASRSGDMGPPVSARIVFTLREAGTHRDVMIAIGRMLLKLTAATSAELEDLDGSAELDVEEN